MAAVWDDVAGTAGIGRDNAHRNGDEGRRDNLGAAGGGEPGAEAVHGEDESEPATAG